jgi:hypothetical protein
LLEENIFNFFLIWLYLIKDDKWRTACLRCGVEELEAVVVTGMTSWNQFYFILVLQLSIQRPKMYFLLLDLFQMISRMSVLKEQNCHVLTKMQMSSDEAPSTLSLVFRYVSPLNLNSTTEENLNRHG